MTIEEFEQRAAYQGGYDRVFDEWKVIDIHEIPNPITESYEIDFYCSNNKRVYLLRLRTRIIEKYEFIYSDKGMGFPPYLIAELPIHEINTNLIKQVLSKFDL